MRQSPAQSSQQRVQHGVGGQGEGPPVASLLYAKENRCAQPWPCCRCRQTSLTLPMPQAGSSSLPNAALFRKKKNVSSHEWVFLVTERLSFLLPRAHSHVCLKACHPRRPRVTVQSTQDRPGEGASLRPGPRRREGDSWGLTTAWHHALG